MLALQRARILAAKPTEPAKGLVNIWILMSCDLWFFGVKENTNRLECLERKYGLGNSKLKWMITWKQPNWLSKHMYSFTDEPAGSYIFV